MSVIQKIRTKYAKVAGFVIAFALVAFILMDALSSRSGNLFGNDDSAVKVNGEKIDYLTYNQRVQAYEVLYGSSQQIDDNMRAQLRDQALQDLVKEQLIKEDAEKIGLTVTEKEKRDMIYGPDPDQSVKTYQAFTNPQTKMFDPQYINLFEQQVDDLDPSGKARAHWENMKEYIVYNSLPKKYNTLFSAAMYVPKFMIKARLDREAEVANIEYVSVPFEDVNEPVELSDDDYKAYINEHKDEYTVKIASRSIEYVPFNILPAAEDTARALNVLNTIKPDFIETKDNESFVNRNSDVSYKESYVKKATYFSPYADSIFSLKTGEVYGPYYEQNNYKLVKLLDKKEYPDSVKCRHILVKTADRGNPVLADSLAKLRIDSAISSIKSGEGFAAMVQKYTDDEGSKNTGGEYTFGFTQKPNLSKEFADFIFDGKTGEKKLVKVENQSYSGYHYIEILNQSGRSDAYNFATIEKALYAGQETENGIYAQASEFSATYSTVDLFDSATNTGKFQKRYAEAIKINDFTIQGLGPAREIIRWMYTAEVGDISPVFQLTGKYVVVKLSADKDKGLMPLDESLKQNIQSDVERKKKGALIVKKYEGKSSLSEISKASGKEIQREDSFRANSSFTGTLGYAPKVVGYSFSAMAKKDSAPKGIVEETGVFFVVPKGTYKQEQRTQDSTIMQREQVMMESQIKNNVSSLLIEEAKADADIKYNADNL